MLGKRPLLITDVTAMRGEAVCFAGVNAAGECIRPIFADRRPILRKHLALKHGGWIRPRAVVAMAWTRSDRWQAPHSEDCFFDWGQVETQFLVSENEWRDWLAFLAVEDVAAALGVELRDGRRARPGVGRASLTTVRASEIEELQLRENQHEAGQHRYRLRFRSEQGQRYDLPVTDLSLRALAARLWAQLGERAVVAERIFTSIVEADEVYLRLGLGRRFRGWHYLQVNGIYTFPDYLQGRCYADFA
ncbi:MAG: hypothetical protein OXF22_06105 [Anaerolineaceae bacterium]|nr:hypothetical protein [Anaerolineaceae bacterium]